MVVRGRRRIPEAFAEAYQVVMIDEAVIRGRFEAMREGIEDYEMLVALAARDHAAAEQICASAVSSFTDYVRDASAFRSIEQKLLDALSRE